MDGLAPNFLILMILILVILGVVIAVIIFISRLPPEKFNPSNAQNAYELTLGNLF